MNTDTKKRIEQLEEMYQAGKIDFTTFTNRVYIAGYNQGKYENLTISDITMSAYNALVDRKDLLEKYVEHLANAILNDDIDEMIKIAAEAYLNAMDRVKSHSA
jgi:hypothetical protein